MGPRRSHCLPPLEPALGTPSHAVGDGHPTHRKIRTNLQRRLELTAKCGPRSNTLAQRLQNANHQNLGWGDIELMEFLRVYETTIEVARGYDTTKTKSIALALTEVALTHGGGIDVVLCPPPMIHIRMGTAPRQTSQQL